MRRWKFQVLLNVDGDLKADTIEVVAADSYGAVNGLPSNIVSWDFVAYEDGSYSQPVEAAA